MSLRSVISRGRRRQIRAAAVATGLALAISSTAYGASWQAPIELSANQSAYVDVVTLDSVTAVSAYDEEASSGSAILTRRTVDGGATWGSPAALAADGLYPRLAAYGTAVDLVYNTSDGVVWYRRSLDGGVTFGPAVALSVSGRYARWPKVAHGPGGVVAVAYVDFGNHNVIVRISTDNGATFGTRHVLSSKGTEGYVTAAVGDGVVYVAYSIGYSSLRATRSTNYGATWSAAAKVTNSLYSNDFTMAADGTHAYIAYTVQTAGDFWHVRYRRTINSGVAWSSEMKLAADSWLTGEPSLALANGILRASFTRCIFAGDYCAGDRVYYRQSSTGTTWSTPQLISPKTLEAGGSAVGANWPIVVYAAVDGNEATYARSKV